jgi:antitoxin component YwqK of YwqJK toxin-antitoxin module
MVMMTKRKRIFTGVLLAGICCIGMAQDMQDKRTSGDDREKRKNLVVKELNTYANGKKQWLDHQTVWDENGFKREEIEYTIYGQRERITFEYDENGKCIRENVFNDKNKLYRIRKYEYLPDGRKKVQYNYNPDGKLYSTKIYDYAYQ